MHYCYFHTQSITFKKNQGSKLVARNANLEPSSYVFIISKRRILQGVCEHKIFFSEKLHFNSFVIGCNSLSRCLQDVTSKLLLT